MAASRIAHLLLPIAVFLIAYGMQRSVALLGLDLHHDAFMFDAAKRMLDGELPFKDFFYQYNLGTVVFHMLALKAFGTYIASLKIATSLVYALIAVFIYMCAAVMGRPLQGLGMALIWSTLSPFYMPVLNGYHAWSTVYMMASVMAGAWFLLLATQKRTALNSGLAGICFNLAFWFKQVAGLQILLVLLWILLNTRRTVVGEDTARTFRIMLLGFVLGGLLSALPYFAYLLANDILIDWWRSAFVFNKFFALTGASSSGLKGFLYTMFPVQRDLGYTTYIWVFLPLYLGVMLLGGKIQGGLLPLRTDVWSRNASLFLMLGLAGWIEYFPLSHAFHTQLFLAPVFCLIALGQISIQEENSRWSSRRLVGLFVFILALSIAYETYQHLKGLREKVTQTRVTLTEEMPAKGLRLLPEYVATYEQFYNKTEKIQSGLENSQAIPMSTDPLRAVFPALNSKQPIFKMGVDWTWPNELVEPGFNQRFAGLIRERQSPIYGDSIIAIPGYMPASLLEMPSPMGIYHTLYLPTADVEVKAPPVIQISKLYILRNVLGLQPASYQFNGSHLECGTPIFNGEILIPYGNLPKSLLANIEDLHISIVSDSEFAKKFTELEYKHFLVHAMAVFDKKISAEHFYIQESNGRYALRPSLTETDWLYLSKFFLARGKMYNPHFATTLAQTEKNQPILVTKPQGNECPQVVWSKVRKYTNAHSEHDELYLAMPEDRVVDGGPMTMFVQIVFKDKTTYSKYLRYGFEGSGMSGEDNSSSGTE